MIWLLGDCGRAATAEKPYPAPSPASDASRMLDFRYAPPKWQTAICLPDDPRKSLVDERGALLYHFGKGGNEFATRVAVEVAPDAVWQKQELHAPRIPIVRTCRAADGLRIVEEAFADTDPPRDLTPDQDAPPRSDFVPSGTTRP